MSTVANKPPKSCKQTILPFVTPTKEDKGTGVDLDETPQDVVLQETQEEESSDKDEPPNVEQEQDEVVLEVSEKEKAKELLREHINRSKQMSTSPSSSNDDGYQSDDTNAAGNKTSLWTKVFNRKDPKVKHVLYYKAKLTIPQNDKFYDAYRFVLKVFMETIQEVDKEAKIIKFKDQTNRSFLASPSEIPESPSKIKEYFACSVKAKSEESYAWPELRIGFNVDPVDFLVDAKILLRDKGEFSIFLKDIQAEQIDTVGYLLYSSQGHDKKRLIRSIQESAFAQHQEKITIALRWKKIADPAAPRRFVKNASVMNKPDDPKALHVETIKGQGDRVADVLRNMYSRSQQTYPDGEKFRFIPLSRYLQKKNEDEVHAKVLQRQRWFLSGSTRATCFELQDIDTTHASIGKSIRQIIFEYKVENGDQLFISIDNSYDGGVSLLFPTAYEAQARSSIADFGSYLRHKYGDMILVKHFTPEAAARAAESEWDAEKMCSISGLERNLNEYIEECDNISWMKQEGISLQAKQTPNPQVSLSNLPKKPSLNVPLPNDDSSLPTLTERTTQSQGSQKRNRQEEEDVRAKKRVIHITDEVSDMDTDTVHTLVTLQSRMDSIESTLANMNDFFQSFRQQNISTTGVHTQPRPYIASDTPRNVSNPASALTDKGEGR